MKKRMNLTLDVDVYESLGEIPRKVSVSELVNWLLKVFVAELKKGRELTDDELLQLTDSMEGGKNFRMRMKAHYGPKLGRVKKLLGKAKIGLDIEANDKREE